MQGSVKEGLKEDGWREVKAGCMDGWVGGCMDSGMGGWMEGVDGRCGWIGEHWRAGGQMGIRVVRWCEG